MRLTITRPDDWHLHLRDGQQLEGVVRHTADVFARAIVMPNLKPPVATVEQALAYRQRILAAVGDSSFEPLMTLYLTPATTGADVREAAAHPNVHAIKLYPAGATTHSEAGVRRLDSLYPVVEVMADVGLPLLIHGESIDPEDDIFDREARFIERTLAPLCDRFPTLKIVLEHITTAEAVAFVGSARDGVAATITAHHLLFNRNAIFRGGIRPDYYCLPVLKRERHRQALLEAITSGRNRFFLGTDSAPHARSAKYAACGCAGIYTAHAALPLYLQVFEDARALDDFEAFASFNGADFYGLPRNTSKITLEKRPWRVPNEYRFGDDVITPLCAGETLNWTVAEES
jgi:dihydroorotase